MLKRPSSRRRSAPEEIVLNLVPMMDALVTLIAFLLFTMTFLNVVGLDSPIPLASTPSEANALQEKPLQLTLTIQRDRVLIWSPFERISPQQVPNLPSGEYDVNSLHDALHKIKVQFPKESQVVFFPMSHVTYDTLVALMDAARIFEKTDAPIYLKSAAGVDEPVKALFPDIVFGNLIGDDS